MMIITGEPQVSQPESRAGASELSVFVTLSNSRLKASTHKVVAYEWSTMV